jgi:hypothetical protein
MSNMQGVHTIRYTYPMECDVPRGVIVLPSGSIFNGVAVVLYSLLCNVHIDSQQQAHIVVCDIVERRFYG